MCECVCVGVCESECVCECVRVSVCVCVRVSVYESERDTGTPDAYITPLAEQQVPRLPREIEAQRRGAEVGRQRDVRGVQHAPCRAASAAPATRNRSTEARS